MLKIDLEKNDKELLLALDGRLDTASSPELEELLKEQLPEVSALTIDMEKLEYVSSAGLRVLMFARRELKKQGSDAMKLTHVNGIIMEIFEVTGFSKIFDIEAAEEPEA